MEALKYHADECSNTGSLFYVKSDFSNGLKVFDTTAGNNAITEILKLNLKIDTNFMPQPNSYWTQKLEVTTYYIDDSGLMKTFKNNVLQSQVPFAYNTMFTEPLTGYTKLISEQTVIVTLSVGKPKFRLSFLALSDCIRTSAYEYFDR